ncbi:hypothetical protein A3Q56_05785 [Intoshia linei]|uniref:N-end rule aminoacyl transferase C-terminal domain-containing protein n=1 Tax=Intoshia linei TaxID=1819745 RepID=A0A177AYK4_9BILA|nr:hypothetical protein A3Q56_05785 [Intoshia linei]
MGYYIHTNPKMNYKAQFSPSYLLSRDGKWQPYSLFSETTFINDTKPDLDPNTDKYKQNHEISESLFTSTLNFSLRAMSRIKLNPSDSELTKYKQDMMSSMKMLPRPDFMTTENVLLLFIS